MPRLFIALPVGDNVKANLARVGRGRPTERGIRWLEPEALHLTLAFLGDVAEREVSDLEDAIYAATEGDSGPLDLIARGIGAFPNEAKARVLWAGVDGELARLGALRERLMGELLSAGFEVDDKRFRPHITLARLRWPQPVPPNLPLIGEFGEWTADEVQLIESRLHASGARYVVRADVPLD